MTLGLLMAPSLSFACGKGGDTMHHKETSAKSCSKICCEKGKKSASCGHEQEDCDGKCGHASCNCVSFSSYNVAVFHTVEYDTVFMMHSFEKTVFGYADTFFKSAINSLRLPPKIS